MANSSQASAMSTEAAVQQRYSQGAQAREEALCCPVQYNTEYLKVIPQEILERDYGCGDPSAYLQPGETVLDLGCGAGKICFIASQVVGSSGQVIGIDCNAEMLGLANQYRDEVAERIGHRNVYFKTGIIQDLALDLDLLAEEMQQNPIKSQSDWLKLRQIEDQLRKERPLIPSNSIDCVVSNCVLNLVRNEDRQQLLGEIFRVLKPGGRVVISDIVSDEEIPPHLQDDPELWSGCLSGAYREDLFPRAFEEAGFYGISLLNRQVEPWQTIENIEFRSLTVQAYKPEEVPNFERMQTVIYRGPFQQVQDEEGRVFPRGVRMAVGDATFRRLQQPPYAEYFEFLEPAEPFAEQHVQPFSHPYPRPAQLTKMAKAPLPIANNCCDSDGCCC
ncbi:Arsenite S-adenosylmethyltransferase [Planctomycetales bacterium 10988]|nr:Arsenite S-adenosylmethyltransferase [Planctomycetales bacterium 10988]